MTAAWHEEQRYLLAERDRLSCLQAGQHGPPFAPELVQAGWFSRLLPWNWYSLDGHGWCFDAEWDEVVRCPDASEIDWNGVSLDGAGAPSLPATHALMFACTVGALLLWFAYEEWAAHKRCVSMGGAAPSPTIWLSSRSVAPWRWERPAQLALAGAALAICVSTLLVSPFVVVWEVSVASE
jgi:hypothetical protein